MKKHTRLKEETQKALFILLKKYNVDSPFDLTELELSDYIERVYELGWMDSHKYHEK